MTDDARTYHRIGPASAIAPGTVKDYQVAGHGIVVANCDGEFHAIEDRCSHDNGPLGEGTLWGCQVECPRHGARFDMKTGRALTLPAVRPVGSYPVREVDGELEVGL